MKSIRLRIESRLENVSLIGKTVNKICSEMPFTEDAVYQTELSVVEACNNVIEHAYLGASDKEIIVDVHLHSDKVIFDIIDSGNQMPMLNRQKMDFDPLDRNRLPEAGMGLFLIHEIMNHVKYKSCGIHNVLTLTKFCTSTPESAHSTG